MCIVKKIICVFISVLMVVTSTITMFAETKKDYLAVIGDSIAYGLGIENKDDIYGNIVANERDYTLTNDAVNGYTTTDVLNLVEKNDKAKIHLKQAETIVISVGGNDFLQLRNNLDFTEILEVIEKGKDSKMIKNMLKTVKQNLRSIHENIRELNPKAKIVLQTVYNPFLGQSDKFTELLCQLVEMFREDYTQIYFDEAKTDSNMVIADVEKTFRTYSNSTGNTSLVQNDYIHPSVKGHRIIADLVEETMDDVHKASWSSVQKSANALVRLGCRMFE